MLSHFEDKIYQMIDGKYNQMLDQEKIFKQAFQEQQSDNIDLICLIYYRISHKLKVEEKFERLNKKFKDMEELMYENIHNNLKYFKEKSPRRIIQKSNITLKLKMIINILMLIFL